jgi:hypothetical protein
MLEPVEPTFEWDPRKESANLEKHGVSFLEATAVFGDPLARIFADEDHSTEERREIIVGHTRGKWLLMVCFTEREQGLCRDYQGEADDKEGTA